ncbi:MAG: hypothetical protein Q8903_13165 [Bacteroidota bacterium]|nr:hypothetical protein [Bacteroidota bacterium]
MLNKISNITTSSDYSKSSSKLSLDYNRQNNVHNLNIVHNDSVNLSPAYQVLKKLNWKLKLVKNTAGKQYRCTFVIGDFEFNSYIEVLPSGSIEYINYDILKENWILKILVSLQVKLEEYKEIRIDNNFLKSMNTLFNRLSLLKIDNEITRKDSSALDDLMDGILNGLIRDFNFINVNLISFLEVNFNTKLNFHFEKSDYIKAISLNKIRLLND